ncbi:MAG TPA: hypothetical protein VGY53_09710, partial [Isosphaeraceae bacterium]|nr:hypothetical protein [Isosphaeraceae bacterium]
AFDRLSFLLRLSSGFEQLIPLRGPAVALEPASNAAGKSPDCRADIPRLLTHTGWSPSIP